MLTKKGLILITYNMYKHVLIKRGIFNLIMYVYKKKR